MVSQLSIGTMGMLRLPSSISLTSVSLVQDTTCLSLFFPLNQERQISCSTRLVVIAVNRSPLILVETLGSPVFPCFPHLSLTCPWTPTRPLHLAIYDALVLSQLSWTIKTLVFQTFRGSITNLRQSLSTLRASISTDYARLASGGWLNLSEQDWLPAGKLRGVSSNLYLFAFKSPPHGFCTAQSWPFHLIKNISFQWY